MTKILIFSIAYHPFVGGAEIAVKEITDRNSDFEYYLITNKFDASWPDEEKIGNINVRRVGNGKKIDKYFYPLRAFRYARRLHAVVKFDFVWSIMAFYAGITALFFKYFSKVPYLLTLQSGDSDSFVKKRTWWWSFYYKRVYRQAKITQSISRYLAQRSRRMGNQKGEIILLPNGVDLDVFQAKLSIEEKNALRQSLNIQTDEFVLISVSRLVLKNAISDVIKAVNFLLYKSGIKVKLLLLGSGPDEKILKTLATKQGVAEQVLFLGYKNYAEIPKYLEISDVFIRPSLSEGLGNAFLESMAIGVPVVGTKVGGIPDFLTDGETGLFCETSSPSSIALAIEKYHKDKELYQKIKSNGQKLVQENYNWDAIALKMKKIFIKMGE